MELNHYIDHTNLQANTTKKEIQTLCEEAIQNHFETVCVAPHYVELASTYLADSTVGITTVVGFPLGFQTTAVKEYEAINAIELGATEIDLVVFRGSIKEHDYDAVKHEIEQIRDAIDGNVLKVIIETCDLTKEEIIAMTKICNETFVNFIKTSTGFGKYGATVEDVELIASYKNEILEIKASGGIKDYDTALAMITAGATRLGTSSGLAIVEGESHDTI